MVGATLAVVSGLTVIPAASAAAPMASAGSTVRLGAVAAADTWASDAVAEGVSHADAADVEQSVAVVDRNTGALLASSDADRVYNSESIVKLFTAAYYLIGANGQPDEKLAEALKQMIVQSDDSIQTEFWRSDIVPSVAKRYSLTRTTSANNASARNWGSTKITANDEVSFLFQMSQDPLVGPLLMSWMATTEPKGADGFDQFFGLNAVTGDHGSKQGWSDAGMNPYRIQSVGWTGSYFVAILQQSDSAATGTLRETSTYTAARLTEATNQVAADAAAAAAAAAAASAARAAACATGDGWIWSVITRKVFAPVASVLPGGGEMWCAAE